MGYYWVTGSLKNLPSGIETIVQLVVVAMIGSGATLIYRGRTPTVRPEILERHHRELRERVFVPWANAKIVASTDTGPYKLPFQTYGAILLRNSANVYWEDQGKAASHLQNKKYSAEVEDSLFKAEGTMEEHNKKVYALQGELERALEVALAKFPRVVEIGKGREWRNTKLILKAIEENAEITQSGPDIYGGKDPIAYVENSQIRELLFGELRSLRAAYSPRFTEAFTDAHFHATLDYDKFKGLVARIIKNIDNLDRLEGKCEVEEGRVL